MFTHILTQSNFTKRSTRSSIYQKTHLLLLCLCTLLTFGCEADQEEMDESQMEVCDADIFCTPGQEMLDSCEGRENCEEVTICGTTTYCAEPEVNCLAEAACAPGQEQLDSCEGRDRCEEVTICGSTIYCAEQEMCLPVVATCDLHEEASYDEPCQEDEICREEVADCSVTYCRPIVGAAMDQCVEGEERPADPFEIEEATIEYDTLWLKTLHSGGCEMHVYAGCFSDFAESAPVQVRIDISHDANGDNCRSSIGKDQPFDLSALKEAYQASYGDGPGEITINIAGTESLEYRF